MQKLIVLVYSLVMLHPMTTIWTCLLHLLIFEFSLKCILSIGFCVYCAAGGGFGMGSKSATTSPTGSVHSTPTHQAKPHTLDPFADLGNLGSSLGGKMIDFS